MQNLIQSKVCEACKKELPISNFYFRKEQGKYRPACKKCKSVKKIDEIKRQAASDYKFCKHCGLKKHSSEYNKAGGGSWYQPYCKPCDKKRKQKYTQDNLDSIKLKRKLKYEKNKKLVPKEIKEANIKNSIKKLIEYNNKNRKRLTDEERKLKKRQYGINYRLKHAESLKQRKVKYARSQEAKERAKKRQAERMKDPAFRILKNLRSRVYVALKRGCKSLTTMELLGCSIDEFKTYFESKFTGGMSWEKYIEGGIHIDHIIPCISFDLTKEEEQRKCFHYTNLQPLWAIDNLKKGTSLKYKITTNV